MRASEIQKIIVKFLNKEANIDDLEKLDKWLDKKENTFLFNRFVQVEFLTALGMGEYDINKAKEQIRLKLNNVKRRNRLTLLKRMSIAASITLIIGFSLYKFYNHSIIMKEISEVEKKINVGSSKAILTLENGNQIRLNKGEKYKNEKVSSNGEELLYTNTKNANSNEEITYNYLTIPRGGEFFIKLSDGTQVWLNSESQLKYPIAFVEGEPRQVELVYGEAYFDVSKSIEHNGSSFKVFHKEQEVKVLGTQFNIKAYSDEVHIYTTLVEGKIAIETKKNQKTLSPNQQAIVNLSTDELKIETVDVYNEISWRAGLFSFENKQLDEVMTVLSRWYNIDVIFTNKDKKKIKFNGVFKKSQHIEEILSMITDNSDKVSYAINEKTITIK
ncbi:DUF4974 domain-containing protein [Lutibacter sp. A80]|uniref:FecR family protein n=1 Tax=Lutibacter sp. A80 TaxID=2918453 RepID=UPI001F060FEF|nr:FecR family protein [Lutibacter sp. A80]UMB59565.1 DUF4974 domain-containing protein [Lutibacter sp. A80]